MNKENIAVVTKYLDELVRKNGEGFYCSLVGNSVYDVYYAIVGEESGVMFQIHGVSPMIKVDYMAESLIDEEHITDFLWLNDMLSAQYRGYEDNF